MAKTATTGALLPMLGTMKISGTSVMACPGGFINTAATACDKPRSSSSAPTTPVTLSLDYDTTKAVLRLKDGGNANYGVIHIHAGDRGPVLLVDIGGTNAYGALIANKLTALSGTEFDGNWRSSLGTLATVSGTKITTTYTNNTSDMTTLQYNKTVIADVISSYDGLGTDTSGRLHVLPLSSAIAVSMYEGAAGTGAGANMSIWFRK